jgi:hypothetical protein
VTQGWSSDPANVRRLYYEGADRCGAGSSVDLGCPSEGLHKRGHHRWDSRSRCCSSRSFRSDRGLHCRPSQRAQVCSSSQTGPNPKTNSSSSSSSKTGSNSEIDSDRKKTSGPRQLLARVTGSPIAPTTIRGGFYARAPERPSAASKLPDSTVSSEKPSAAR